MEKKDQLCNKLCDLIALVGSIEDIPRDGNSDVVFLENAIHPYIFKFHRSWLNASEFQIYTIFTRLQQQAIEELKPSVVIAVHLEFNIQIFNHSNTCLCIHGRYRRLDHASCTFNRNSVFSVESVSLQVNGETQKCLQTIKTQQIFEVTFNLPKMNIYFGHMEKQLSSISHNHGF